MAMSDTLSDIGQLKQASIMLKEGASDEKRAGMNIIESMITAKEAEVTSYENQLDLFFGSTQFSTKE
jgi:hypothetical protein|tara:strand:- start:1164 stop:1364 length:201 start_codon:yes stop_codon:yes gene_type:complete